MRKATASWSKLDWQLDWQLDRQGGSISNRTKKLFRLAYTRAIKIVPWYCGKLHIIRLVKLRDRELVCLSARWQRTREQGTRAKVGSGQSRGPPELHPRSCHGAHTHIISYTLICFVRIAPLSLHELCASLPRPRCRTTPRGAPSPDHIVLFGIAPRLAGGACPVEALDLIGASGSMCVGVLLLVQCAAVAAGQPWSLNPRRPPVARASEMTWDRLD